MILIIHFIGDGVRSQHAHVLPHLNSLLANCRMLQIVIELLHAAKRTRVVINIPFILIPLIYQSCFYEENKLKEDICVEFTGLAYIDLKKISIQL